MWNACVESRSFLIMLKLKYSRFWVSFALLFLFFLSLLHINWCDYGILVQDILKSKAVREKVDGIIGKVDTRIIKDGNFGAEDVLVEEESRQLIQEKESNYEINTVDDRLDDKQIKAPSKRVRNVVDVFLAFEFPLPYYSCFFFFFFFLLYFILIGVIMIFWFRRL